jgi:hypothetical protein
MELTLHLVPRIGSVFIRILGATWRLHFYDEPPLEELRGRSPGIIYAFWHGRFLPLSYTHRNRSIHVLASEHRDGELMGRIISRLGFGHVRGSSTRGGARAIMRLSEKVREGYDLGLTVDGPKGPKYVVKSGAVEIAKLTGAAIVPITTASSSHFTFSSWDEFQIPKPFAHVIVCHGEPILVPRNAGMDEVEEKRLVLEKTLKTITETSDKRAREKRY